MIKKIFYSLLFLGFLVMIINHESFLTLCFGLALFLYGMGVLSDSFKLMNGGLLENFLKKATKKLSNSFAFGLVSTAIMQSSGLVTVLTISFLNASLITLVSSLAIIYGANLGTTTGAWLMSGVGFKIDMASWAMPLIICGAMFSFLKQNNLKGAGYFLLSIGFILLGMAYMKGGFESIKETLDLSKFAMDGFRGVVIYAIIGVIITALMQSSHATLMVVLAALASHQVSYENALAIVIGSNVGSTIMAVLAAIGASSDGKRLALGHVIFNTTMALIFIALFYQILPLVDKTATLFGIANDDYLLKLSLFHTYFSLFGVMLFYPLNSRFEAFLKKAIKEKVELRDAVSKATFIDESLLESVESSKEMLLKEVKHLYKNTLSILAKTISISSADVGAGYSKDEILKLRDKPLEMNFDELYETRFKGIYSDIVDFSSKLSLRCDKQSDKEFIARLGQSSLYMANALKNARNLQENVYKFLGSNNQYIKEIYNEIRALLYSSLNLIDGIVMDSNKKSIQSDFKDIALAKKEFENISIKGIKELHMNSKIDALMTTSLINDSSLAWDTLKELRKMAKLIFISENQDKADIFLLEE